MRTLAALAGAIDTLNRHVGLAVAWLALVMALVQFSVVILRYVFAVGFIPMQESIWYLHGVLFMLGAGYTLLLDGHVRVDIFYREASPRFKATVNLLGVVLLLLPVCVATWWTSWSYVGNSWRVLEGSTETSGLPFIYLLKTVILVFLALVAAQGVSLAIKSALVLAGSGGYGAGGPRDLQMGSAPTALRKAAPLSPSPRDGGQGET